MEEKILWESKLKDEYLYFSNIEDYFKYLDDNNKSLDFIIKDSYTPGEDVENFLDNAGLRDNQKITYTDESHPIALAKKSFFPTMINSHLYEKYKNEFKEYALRKFQSKLQNKDSYIVIPDFIFDDKLLAQIIINQDNDDIHYCFVQTIKTSCLTENQKAIIKENFLDFTARYRIKENEQISSKHLISYYTKKDLENIKHLDLYIPLKDIEIDNLKYVNKNAVISLMFDRSNKQDESTYLKQIAYILKKIANHNHNYNFKIYINNREILRTSKLLNNIPKNANLIIYNDLYDYNLDTYLKEETKLEKMVSPIRDSDMSPLEKYLAVYDIVKKFKDYKENKDKPDIARNLRYILDDNNAYIVCVGFSALLSELLNRVGISNAKISPSIDTSYDKGYTQEAKNLNLSGHARNLIHLDDNKYHIHGYYLADSTWDNYLETDIYLNALMTFDRKKEAKRLERLGNVDLTFDFHNLDEFKAKIKHLITREVNSTLYNISYETYSMKKIKDIKEKYHNKIANSTDKKKKQELKIQMNNEITEIENYAYIQAYKMVYNIIMNILKDVDQKQYSYLFDKYQKQFTDYNITLEELENTMNNMLFEYAKYILPLSNNNIPIKDIIKAAAIGKRKIEYYSDNEIKEWLPKTLKDNKELAKKTFPYRYDPNNQTEAYLEDIDEEKRGFSK